MNSLAARRRAAQRSAVPAAQDPAPRPPPASCGCSPVALGSPRAAGVLPSPPGSLARRTLEAPGCPSACVGTAVQKRASRAASGLAGLREPRAPLPCAACAGRGCPTSAAMGREVAGTGLGAACPEGASWLQHRHQRFQFPPGNCFCQYFNFIWAAQAEAEAVHPKQIVCHPPRISVEARRRGDVRGRGAGQRGGAPHKAPGSEISPLAPCSSLTAPAEDQPGEVRGRERPWLSLPLFHVSCRCHFCQ